MYYEGAFQLTLQQEEEERTTIKGVDGEVRKADKVYNDPSENVEAQVLGLFETGEG